MLRNGKNFRMYSDQSAGGGPSYIDGRPISYYTFENLTFDKWKSHVEKIVYETIGIKCDELPDEDYWLNWDGGTTSLRMAQSIALNFEQMLDFYENHYLLQKEKKMKV